MRSCSPRQLPRRTAAQRRRGLSPHGDAARPRVPLPSALQGGALGGQAQGPGVAFDGTNYLVVWTDSREGGPKVYGARVSPGGTVLDQDGFAISAAAGSEPTVAFDGTNYLVVWSNQASIVGARVDPGGTVLDPGGITISTRANAQFQPTLAFDGTNYLVVWTTREPLHRRLRRAGVSVRDRARPGGDRDRDESGIQRGLAVGCLRRDELPRRLGGRPVPPHLGQASQPRRDPGRRR